MFSFACATNTSSIWTLNSDWGVFLPCTLLSNGDYPIPAAQASIFPSSVRSSLAPDLDGNFFVWAPVVNARSAATRHVSHVFNVRYGVRYDVDIKAGKCLSAVIGTIMLIGSAWKIFAMKRRRWQQRALAVPKNKAIRITGRSNIRAPSKSSRYISTRGSNTSQGYLWPGCPPNKNFGGVFRARETCWNCRRRGCPLLRRNFRGRRKKSN
ncbi:hypothetical protein GGR53DRAFT_531087 [Hypoxylon sp. FL1150]|nr:hypothetical protein GGR53DRAFT_531087 [Hypoxylon sp. FL1150]